MLLGEAANPEQVEAIRQAINNHPNVIETVGLLIMNLVPTQILINAHVNLKDELTNEQIVRTIKEVEEK